MTNIVLSYRREDTQPATRLLHERLNAHYGNTSTFLDLDSVPPGVNTRDHILDVLADCDVFLVVIGKKWRGSLRGTKNRLFDERDWVRFEIETAFRNNLRVIPVRIDDAPMPKPEHLPESIRELADINAVDISTGKDLQNHMQNLFAAIDTPPKRKVAHPPPPDPPVPEPLHGEDIALATAIKLEECAFGTERIFDLPGGRHVAVHIPAGTRDGDILCMAGEGAPGEHGGKAGDLRVTVSLAEHAVYKRSGSDLTMALRLGERVARGGGSERIFTLTGPVLLTVPPGSSDGGVLKIAGRGLPASASRAAGDLFVTLAVVLEPKPEPVAGDDILAQIAITLDECFSGTTAKLTVQDGAQMRETSVRIPAGTRAGDTIRVVGQGRKGRHGGADGDLLVSVKIEHHAVFARDGDDLKAELDVPISTAQNGGTVNAKTPGGEIAISVPANSSEGNVLRARRKGLPPTQSSPAGDLYLRIRIVGDPIPDVVSGAARPPLGPQVMAGEEKRAGRGWLLVPAALVALAVGYLLWRGNLAPAPDRPPIADVVPVASTGSSVDYSEESHRAEADAVGAADIVARWAAVFAQRAEDEKKAANEEAVRANDNAKANPETFTLQKEWSSRDTTKFNVTYYGFGANSTVPPNGTGVMKWDHPCETPVDGTAPGRRYEGHFEGGAMKGLGVYHKCDGTVIWGDRIGDLTDGSAISQTAHRMFSGTFKSGNAVLGITTRDPVVYQGVVSEAGRYDAAGRLDGYGVVTCDDKSKWKGNWAHGLLSGYATHFAADWTVLQHGDFGGSGIAPPPNPCR